MSTFKVLVVFFAMTTFVVCDEGGVTGGKLTQTKGEMEG